MIQRLPLSPLLRRFLRRAHPDTVRILCAALAFALLSGQSRSAQAQISITTAVDLALRNNPRIRSAEDEVKKARAQLSEVYAAYIPAITAGGGIGNAYGYSSDTPKLGNVSGGSLIFSASQSDYIRSARSGLKAAQLAVDDACEGVAESTALAFITLNHDQERQKATEQQTDLANSLVTIVQQRLDAGQDTQIELTQAQLTAAQLRLASMKAQDDVQYDREHLSRLIDLPTASLSIDDNFPLLQSIDVNPPTSQNAYANAAVGSMFESAQAREQQASGMARFRLWPEITFVAQYNRYATFTQSFSQLQQVYTIVDKNGNSHGLLTANEGAFGILISLPVLDRGRSAKALETAAEAAKARHDAQSAQLDALDGASRVRHNIAELRAQSNVARLQQQLAQQQLDAIQIQLESGNGNPNSPQMSPKDWQKARISERDKYLGVLDAEYQLRQAEIQLLRQTGNLQSWLKSSLVSPPSVPASAQP